jgi:RNA polymerase sigma factor (sigma-70 family)
VVVERDGSDAGRCGELDDRCDRELVERARAGDRHAFGILYGRHRALIRGLCRRTVADPVAVEDIVQEATLAAWLNLGYLQKPESFASWWCGIVLNHARRHLAGQGAQERALSRHGGTEPAEDSWTSPEGQVERAEMSARVRGAVAELPPSQRNAAYRFYLQGLTYREAADELGISINALKARLHQGRRALRHSLNDLALHDPALPDPGPKEPSMPTTEFTPVDIVDVRWAPDRERPDAVPHLVLLKAKESERYLTIFIAAPEGASLALSLEGEEMPRPMTHQLTTRLVAGCGGEISGVAITRLVESTFYATVTLVTREGSEEVDARPSDALNLAALTGAPVTVEASLLSEVDDAARAAWSDLPGRTQIVEQVWQRHDELMARLARRRAEE